MHSKRPHYIHTILIHTSVKLVTKALKDFALIFYILIHTSVKLVTVSSVRVMTSASNFNPHAREARDEDEPRFAFLGIAILIHTSVKLVTRTQTEGTQNGLF